MRSRQRKAPKQPEDPTSPPLSPTPYPRYPNPTDKLDHSRPKNGAIKHSLRQKLSQGKQSKDRLDHLQRQNADLRKEIVQLKVHQFYHFDDKKLKELIAEVEQLRKELKKLKQHAGQLELENDFLRRTNAQLKLELEKDIQLKYKESVCQDTTKCTVKYGLNRIIDDEISHVSNVSSNNLLQNTTLEEALENYRQYDSYQQMEGHRATSDGFKLAEGYKLTEKRRSGDLQRSELSKQDLRYSRKNGVEKCISPRRQRYEQPSQSPNQYNLMRRHKERSPILQRLQ